MLVARPTVARFAICAFRIGRVRRAIEGIVALERVGSGAAFGSGKEWPDKFARTARTGNEWPDDCVLFRPGPAPTRPRGKMG